MQAHAPYERPALTKGYLFPLDKKPARLPVTQSAHSDAICSIVNYSYLLNHDMYVTEKTNIWFTFESVLALQMYILLD